MGKQLTSITDSLKAFIEQQQLFFVATAGTDGKVNLSPKGMDTLKVLDGNRVIWLNLTGSGNETAAHILEQNRMTLMFCSFDKNPMILRLYGTARFYQLGDEEWGELIRQFPNFPGARQLFDVKVEMVQTSCGFGVPRYQYEGQRDALIQWAEKKGAEGINEYQKERNSLSLDGKPTGMKRE
ncbi:MAG: pyridoxamine 5'-phosphate oxidase family protein [Lewinellaceae bacterium]|nr:pyridoxamine 5'-phosphate oxidase family protein [Phaeodactylibacter sp.]MCB0613850.1 pyridoxamine 5'-phosphate oxidase family protein [Phaeodactylibacter sp.]MCB9346306.1 pyridoxamine 5'-phosphate oxidase family protein [Lewinellaceae bacterium]